MDKTKIRISYDAYYKLMDFIQDRNEFNCVTLDLKNGCGSKLDILLDKKDENLITEYIDELPLYYGPDIHKNLKTITIVYRDDSFKIKAESYTDSLESLLPSVKKEKNCSSCSCPKRK